MHHGQSHMELLEKYLEPGVIGKCIHTRTEDRVTYSSSIMSCGGRGSRRPRANSSWEKKSPDGIGLSFGIPGCGMSKSTLLVSKFRSTSIANVFQSASMFMLVAEAGCALADFCSLTS